VSTIASNAFTNTTALAAYSYCGSVSDSNLTTAGLGSKTRGSCASQSINFPVLSDATLGGTAPTLAAVATSTFAVTYTSGNLSICTVSGSTVTMRTVGTCSITADQIGDGSNSPATSVTRSFTIAPAVVFVEPTPVPYLKTLTTPKLNLKDGKLICTPGTYNAGYTLNGVTQGSATTVFTPGSFTYNLLINGISQTSLGVTTSSATASWSLSAAPAASLASCSVTITANSLTSTDKSSDNTSVVSSALSTQTTAIATADAAHAVAVSANTKAYQKALVDNRANWRTDVDKVRAAYLAELDRIRSLAVTKTTRAQTSAALKAYTAAQKKTAADYKASQPAAAIARDAANKAALDIKNTAIAKANATYGTFIDSVGFGVLIP
jgi:hypothetical protein